MSTLWNLPARYDGPHSRHGSLVRSEAWRHLAIAHRLDHFSGSTCETCAGPMGVLNHLITIENSIYGHLTRGWARYRDDGHGILFWNPMLEEFEVFTEALLMTWASLFDGLASLKDARPYAGQQADPIQEVESDEWVVTEPDWMTRKH